MGLRDKKNTVSGGPLVLTRIQLITMLLSYKRFDKQSDYLVLRNNTYAEFIRTDGKNTEGLSFDQRKQLLENFGDFNGQYLEDYEIISSKFPTNTSKQQVFWGRKYAKWIHIYQTATEERMRMQAKRRLDAALHYISDEKEIEKNLYNFDFVFVFFAETPEALATIIKRAKQISKDRRGNSDDVAPLIFHDMTHQEKENVLFRLNNPNARMN